MRPIIVNAGDRFGRLSVLSECEKQGMQRRFRLICDCGAETLVTLGALRMGTTLSCGCLRRETTRKNATTHGQAKGAKPTAEWMAWKGMKQRCYTPSASNFQHYGGRGIRVCERWLAGFENFYADMGKKPSPHHSLDRIDANKNYEPDNCRWATQSDQCRNQRRNRILEFQGRSMTLAEFSCIIGRDATLVRYHLGQGRSTEYIADFLS